MTRSSPECQDNKYMHKQWIPDALYPCLGLRLLIMGQLEKQGMGNGTGAVMGTGTEMEK